LKCYADQLRTGLVEATAESWAVFPTLTLLAGALTVTEATVAVSVRWHYLRKIDRPLPRGRAGNRWIRVWIATWHLEMQRPDERHHAIAPC